MRHIKVLHGQTHRSLIGHHLLDVGGQPSPWIQGRNLQVGGTHKRTQAASQYLRMGTMERTGT